jgi:hypothetical protein
MDYHLLKMMADGLEYTVGEVIASTATEAQHITRVRRSLQNLYDYGYVDRRGRGLHFFRITEDGRDVLFAYSWGLRL